MPLTNICSQFTNIYRLTLIKPCIPTWWLFFYTSQNIYVYFYIYNLYLLKIYIYSIVLKILIFNHFKVFTKTQSDIYICINFKQYWYLECIFKYQIYWLTCSIMVLFKKLQNNYMFYYYFFPFFLSKIENNNKLP